MDALKKVVLDCKNTSCDAHQVAHEVQPTYSIVVCTYKSH